MLMSPRRVVFHVDADSKSYIIHREQSRYLYLRPPVRLFVPSLAKLDYLAAARHRRPPPTLVAICLFAVGFNLVCCLSRRALPTLKKSNKSRIINQFRPVSMDTHNTRKCQTLVFGRTCAHRFPITIVASGARCRLCENAVATLPGGRNAIWPLLRYDEARDYFY